MRSPIRHALTIAGSDSSGGAGVLADTRTFAAFDVLGCAAITAITAQNTTGVRRWEPVSPALVADQMKAVLEDIPVAAAKTGMLATESTVVAVAETWRQAGLVIPLVVDPVMESSSGSELLDRGGVEALRRVLLPLATVLMPNEPEAHRLLAATLPLSPEDCVDQLAALAGPEPTVVLTGGQGDGTSARDLVRLPDGRKLWLEAPRIRTSCDHGTGCTLSAAVCALLALGLEMEQALRCAKSYLTEALERAKPVGQGRSGVDHLWTREPRGDDHG